MKIPERSGDWYGSYGELIQHEKEGVDFRIILNSGSSGIAVMAPHGGGIEPGTTEIGAAIVSHEHTFYSFEGLKASGNEKLHLTSTIFDEPVALETARRARSVLAIHGCAETEAVVYVGGRDLELKAGMSKTLEQDGFTVDEHAGLTGKDPMNLCNRGTSGGGVQLEISSGLRRQMFADLSRPGRKTTTPVFEKFITAVRQALKAE